MWSGRRRLRELSVTVTGTSGENENKKKGIVYAFKKNTQKGKVYAFKRKIQTSSSSLRLPLVVCPAVHLFCLFLCSMGPEFDPVETANNDVQDEMPQMVKPPSGKEEFYNRSTAAA